MWTVDLMPTELEVADLRVREAERHIARQRALLEGLNPADSLKEVGATLLGEMEAQLAAEKQNRDWIVRNGWADRSAGPR
jgi:hypothetical protein